MDIAKKALAAGDAAKAQRFAAKAVNMGGADGAADLLQRAQEAVATGGEAEGAPPTGAEPQTAEPATSAPAAPASGPAGSSRKTDLAEGGNDEQKQMVRRILKTGNYYDILGIPQGADEEAIKKAYKKTALKLHPDKCKAAGAEEAFKKVSRAFQCLSDAKKRSLYDKYGDEEKIPQSQNFRGDFVDANEIFAQFFGEAFNGGGGQAFGFPGGGGFTFHIGGSGFGPMGGGHVFHMGGGHPRQRVRKQAVKLTLEELREGVERHEEHNGTTFKLVIKPGTKAGKTFDFEENGVQFVVQEQKHERFDRKGDDVHHVATVPVAGFLFGCEYRLKLLTGQTKTVQFGPLPLTAVHINGAGVSPEGRCIVRASPVAPEVLAQLRGWAKLLWWIVLLFFFMRNPALLFLFVLFRQFLPI